MKKEIIKIRKRRKKKFFKNLFLFFTVIFFSFIFLVLSYSLYRSISLSHSKNKKVQEMKARLEKIKQENRNYKEEIEKLQTPEEIEKMARKMGFIKKNEISFEIDKISKEDKSKIKKGKNF